MFKGIIHISFAFLFLFTSGGVILNKHYCGNKFVSSSLFLTPHSCCNGHCNKCHNETKVYKITDNFQDSSFTINLTQYFNELFNVSSSDILISYCEHQVISRFFVDTSPPPGSKIVSLLQVFRL